jgi:hypothetical protein
VATKQVNIDILAKDKTRQAMRSATMGVDKLKSAVFNLRNAFIGLGAGLVAKSFLDTAREVENLRVRFKFLFADAQEGEKAFKGLVKFAGQVPFSLAEIQRGSANLAVVSKNAEELNNLLKITGDIASASGLDFATTAEQIQRTFSSGINSADLFRERGVKALLGFEAGVQISAEESRKHILTAFEDGTLSVVGASKDMAQTFDGVMSMIGDKFLGFKMAMMDSAPFEFIKSNAMLIEQELNKNFGSIEKFAEKMGKALVEGFKNFLLMGAKVIDTFQPVFSFLGKSVENLVNYVRGLPAPLDTLGVIGFLMLGTKGKALVFLIGGVLDEIRSVIGHTIDAMATVQEKLNSFTLGRSKKSIEDAKLSIYELRVTAETLKTPLSEVEEKLRETGITALNNFVPVNSLFDDTIKRTGTMTEKVENYLKSLDKVGEKQKQLKEMGGLDVGGFLSTREQKATQSMTGMETEFGMAKGMSKTGDIDALQAIADMELVIAQDTATKRLQIADKTARDERNIRQSFINEQTAIMKSGQFQDLKMTNLTEQQKKDTIIAGGKAILSSMAQNNKKAFKLNKALGMAEAMINTAQGVTKALATGNIPMAILIGALGAVQIATIASQKYQGRRLGGRMNQDQPYLVGEAGPELVVPDRASNVVPNGQLGNMGKQVNVNFHITTVDATGFSELLVNSRATIVNVINQALNEKGKEVLV